MYKLIFRSLITQIDPEFAHHQSIKGISLIGRCPFSRGLFRALFARRLGTAAGPWIGNEEGLKGISRRFPGYLGLAAGMDKDAEAILGLSTLGFAFIEVGTVTAQAQPGNDRPRLWRIVEDQLIRNRMGFNNLGAKACGEQLRKLRTTSAGRKVIVGANIGKTKATPLGNAVADYVYSTTQVAKWADYLVVNVSSPNTPGLRDLQQIDRLRPILMAVQETANQVANRRMPLLVKIAPDLALEDLAQIADLVKELNLAGVVATNTTINHDFPDGGLSGPCLTERSRDYVRFLRDRLGPNPIIIGVGGITTVEDAQLMLEAGADLLQGLTALIYQGPAWPGRINRALDENYPGA